ncbi:integrase [Rhizobium leguminosarum]|uniref:Integrase n=1 Tax=Rhizobium leguminosarum TaxID=384 RepID=A0AAE2SVE1_RHILE|nr:MULTISPECIES: site-specific integrase [Rhizobium]MBB4289510.1 integrase [Rhizobium leguminosarum]MBB4294393.1 integrase [Rhizobium leguminosarum]MBB4305790.1 integrase [Rhizobium leguminosarum]MBB4418633.1 integrase [Rhizobium leguminosarum]MBB4433478.1 integrase [Rhizobium esperanzae]
MARQRNELTVKFCDSVRPSNKPKEYPDGKSSLALRVSPSGAKTWTMRHRVNGKQKRFHLGNYSEISLASARAECMEIKLRGASALTPLISNPVALTASGCTIARLADEYIAACWAGRHKHKARRKKDTTIKNERTSVEQHIKPSFGETLIDRVQRETIQTLVDELRDRVSDSAARRAKQALHAMYSYAIWNNYTANNPCVYVFYPEAGSRKVVLSDEQLRTIWEAFTPPVKVPGVAVSDSVALSILIAMVTVQRIGEILRMRVSDLDLENSVWTIPPHLTKNNAEHLVPLSPLAVHLIKLAIALRKDASSDAVFQGRRNKKISVTTQAATRAFGRVKKALSWGDIRIHDERRTATTHMAKPPLRVLPFILSKVLNHLSDTGGAARVTSVYNRWEYFDEKKEALDKWEARLRDILTLRQGAIDSGSLRLEARQVSPGRWAVPETGAEGSLR